MAYPRYPCRPLQQGFSLLETIAAILLLALAFGAVMHVAGAATQLTGHARELSRVGMWADSSLDAAGREVPLQIGTHEGWYDKRHRWRMTVAAQTPFPGQAKDLHMYHVGLDVMWKEGVAERTAHFATVRLQDEPSPPSSSSVAMP
jgi:general secretion pathway protein I